MKPKHLFGVVFAVLFLGTAAARFANTGAHGAAMPGAALACGADADNGRASCDLAIPKNLRPTVIAVPGAVGLGCGEAVALKAFFDCVSRNPDRAVMVVWKEQYKSQSLEKRACYVPGQRKIYCETPGHGAYTYEPVTPDGIRAELRDGNDAPFAGANLYSIPRIAME